MYKVFINEHLICWSESNDFSISKENKFWINDPSVEGFNCLTEWLLKEPLSQVVEISSEDCEISFQTFCDSFRIIEAAGGLVRNGNKEILFIHRLGKWDLPKGKIEKGEDKKEAALREVEEECGVNALKIENELCTTYHIYKFKEELVLKRTFWYEMSTDFEGELVPQIEEDIHKVVWVDANAISSQLADTYGNIKMVLADALKF